MAQQTLPVMNSLKTTCEIEKQMSLFLHQTAVKPLCKTTQNTLYLNSVAYQHYLSIFKSFYSLTLNNNLPQETGDCFCVVFLSMEVKPWRLGTCVMNSMPSDAEFLGYFINSKAQCSSITKAPLLSCLRPPPRQTAKYSLPSTSLHILAIIPLSTSTPQWLTGLQDITSTGTQHVSREHTILL